MSKNKITSALMMRPVQSIFFDCMKLPPSMRRNRTLVGHGYRLLGSGGRDDLSQSHRRANTERRGAHPKRKDSCGGLQVARAASAHSQNARLFGPHDYGWVLEQP